MYKSLISKKAVIKYSNIHVFEKNGLAIYGMKANNIIEP